MIRIGIFVAISALLLVPAPGAEAQPSLDARVERGRAIANQVCWACHVTGADQEFSPILRNPGPDFRVIAKRSDITTESLKTFLRGTHQTEGKPYTMPNPRLTDDMIDDVVSYILNLQNRH